MGPDSTRVHKRQYAQFFAAANAAAASSTPALKPTSFSSHYSTVHPHLMMMETFVSVDAPYGDHFSLADRIELVLLTPPGPGRVPKTRVRISIIARFSKFTFMKGILR